MTSTRPGQFRAKALRDGGMIRMLDFAVRGLPCHYMPGEQRIDRDWAVQVYWPELQQLDSLRIHSRWFWSGSVGAALVSLALWPDSLELWQRLAEHRIRRDESGADAPCLLMEMVYRYQDAESVTRSPAFQLYLFQQSLAVAQACAHQGDYGRQFQQRPPVPDIVELLDKVRHIKGQRHTMVGFRPARILRRWWIEPEEPKLVHSASLKDARALADSAASISRQNLSTKALDAIEDRLAELNPPKELCHPAALAAAFLSVADDAGCWSLWAAALSGQGLRIPTTEGRPLKDTATRMQDAIIEANRQKEPVRAAIRLFHRLCKTIDRWHASGERLLANLPGARKSDPKLEEAWTRLDVALAPELVFDSQPQKASPTAEPAGAGNRSNEDSPSQTGNRKRPRSGARRRLKTGRKGENWLMANYQGLFPQFGNSRLQDCREVCEGYDFTLKAGRMKAFIEVKTLLRDSGSIQLDDCQWRKAHEEGSRYYLVVVLDVGSDQPYSLVIRDPASVLDPERRLVVSKTTRWVVDNMQLKRLLAKHAGAEDGEKPQSRDSDAPK